MNFLHVIRKRKKHLTMWMLYFSSSGSQIVWCICVGQKYENVYYLSRFNILIRGARKKRGKNMRAASIFIAFFLIFTAASIAVPIPLFPGNMIAALFGIPASDYMPYLEALTNGLTYGFVTWLVFFLIDKKLEKSMSINSKK